MRVSAVTGPRELRAAALAVRGVDADIRRAISRSTVSTLGPVWTAALDDRTTRPLDRLVRAGARIAGGNPPALLAGNSRRRIGHSLSPTEHWHALEYGADRRKTSTYRRRGPGRPTDVTRRTRVGLPNRNRTGRIIGPAVAHTLPRLARLWTQTVVRVILDATESR